MKLSSVIKTVGTVLFGCIVGMVLSDVAFITSFPRKDYKLHLRFAGTPSEVYRCGKIGGAAGQDFSQWDPVTQRQTNCILRLGGELRPDGSFDAYSTWATWEGRLYSQQIPIHIPADQIISVQQDGQLTESVRLLF